jgi:hypothetical protein
MHAVTVRQIYINCAIASSLPEVKVGKRKAGRRPRKDQQDKQIEDIPWDVFRDEIATEASKHPLFCSPDTAAVLWLLIATQELPEWCVWRSSDRSLVVIELRYQ